MYNPTNLRHLDHVEHSLHIRDMKTSPLILIKANGEIFFANSRNAKDELINSFNEKEDALLFSWAGQWSTDVFALSKKDLNKHYDSSQ